MNIYTIYDHGDRMIKGVAFSNKDAAELTSEKMKAEGVLEIPVLPAEEATFNSSVKADKLFIMNILESDDGQLYATFHVHPGRKKPHIVVVTTKTKDMV